jgi:hypothetical protein
MATETEAPSAALPDFLLDPNVVLKDGTTSGFLLYSSHHLLATWGKL